MKSNHRSAVWPYLLLLGGLFLLSVTAPRGWQVRPPASRAKTAALPSAETRSKPSKNDQPVILRAQANPSQKHARTQISTSRPQPDIAHISLFEASERVTRPTGFLGDENADSLQRGDETIYRFAVESNAAGSYVSDDSDEPESMAINTHGRPRQPPLKSGGSGTDNAANATIGDSTEETLGEVQSPPEYDQWPLPYALIAGLDRLTEHRGLDEWAADVRALLNQLASTRLDDPASTGLLVELRTAAAKSPVMTDQPGPGVEREFEQSRLDLLRRLDLWEKVEAGAATNLISMPPSAGDSSMHEAVVEVSELTYVSPVGETWRNYLRLARIEQLARRIGDDVGDERRRVANVVLARMIDPRLTADQRAFLAQEPLVNLKHRLRSWTIEELEIGELLHAVENYEAAPLTSFGQTLSDQSVVLIDSRNLARQRIGRELVRQYGNANVRLVVTRELVNRLLPQPQPSQEFINETVIGVPSRGSSTVSTQLSIRFIPAADQIRFGIEATGLIDSQTASTAGPVTFLSQGESTYRVGKLVTVDRNGVRADRATAEANNRTRLSGMETDFDAIPFVRNFVRSYALTQHDEKKGQARQEVETKVAARAKERLDDEVNARLAGAEKGFRQRFAEPLQNLGLHQTVVELKTTDERATMRLRLAGDGQLGAHTPRPLAMSDSLATLQIHESALNNALDCFQLAGRKFTLPELYQWIGQRLGRSEVVIPDDLPEEVTVTFADTDPIRLCCHDGRVDLTLAIAEIDDVRRAWYDIEIAVHYRPQYDGLRLEFVRDGNIELSCEGHAGRTEIVLRGIFAKVFSQKRRLKFEPNVQPENPEHARLQFSSAVVDNGWISITVADRK